MGRREAWFEGQLDLDPERLVFMADPCGWCRIFLAHVLRCDGFNALAGLAHFMILMDTTGASAIVGGKEQGQLRRLLKVEEFPTTPAVSVKAGTQGCEDGGRGFGSLVAAMRANRDFALKWTLTSGEEATAFSRQPQSSPPAMRNHHVGALP
ncbi:hypothetical protein V5F85_16325 [Xanthobacter autotrophicus ATCC 700551]